MTPLADLFERIEGARFSARVNIASDLKTFLRAVAEQSETQELQEQMAAQEVRDAVCDRAAHLTGAPHDPHFEHPHDVAVATYILLLSTKEENLALRAASHLAQTGPWWWASHILDRNSGVSGSGPRPS
jgi:hypothetical protein